jgi:hypothetical protein
MKYPLLNCEGDFLLVEKIGKDWFFKLLTRGDDTIKGGSPYQLIVTTPLDILSYLRGDWELYNEEYKTLNFREYSNDYKNPNKIKALISDLIGELNTEFTNNQDEFLKQFYINRNND